MFLGINGHDLNATDAEVVSEMLALADGRVSEEELAEWIRQHSSQRKQDPLAMVNVSVLDDRVVFEVEGLHQLWALRSRVEIPLTHITGAEFDPAQVGKWWHGWKLVGTDVPGLFAAGTFYYHGELVFWDVRDPNNAVIVSLDHERYKKLIIEVQDPPEVVGRLRAALA